MGDQTEQERQPLNFAIADDEDEHPLVADSTWASHEDYQPGIDGYSRVKNNPNDNVASTSFLSKLSVRWRGVVEGWHSLTPKSRKAFKTASIAVVTLSLIGIVIAVGVASGVAKRADATAAPAPAESGLNLKSDYQFNPGSSSTSGAPIQASDSSESAGLDSTKSGTAGQGGTEQVSTASSQVQPNAPTESQQRASPAARSPPYQSASMTAHTGEHTNQTHAPSPAAAPSPALIRSKSPPSRPAKAPAPAKKPDSKPSTDGMSDKTDALCAWSDLYLPTTVVPLRYDLAMNVYFNSTNVTTVHFDDDLENTIDAEVNITLSIEQPTFCVVLHSNNINIFSDSIAFHPANGDDPIIGQLKKNNIHTDRQQIVLLFTDVLLPGTADEKNPLGVAGILQIAFAYDLKPGLDGFYLSSYADAGVVSTVAATQFESIAARKAFPCFDEPHFKANFSLSLGVPDVPGIVALSNMPVLNTLKNNATNLTDYTFETSPPMSTYLMAWVVGNLKNVSYDCPTDTLDDARETARKVVPINVYSTPTMTEQIQRSVYYACSALLGLVKTLGVPYPLPKLDIVGIPNFAAGAMENWGLITFRESSLFMNTRERDKLHEMKVALTIAHEISHQWFGNLVTHDDWTDLWLTEGLASYFEYVGADAIDQHLGLPGMYFFMDTTVPGLVADSLSSSHPMARNSKITELPQIDNMFDQVSYQKGAAIMHMLRAHVNIITGGAAASSRNPKVAAAGSLPEDINVGPAQKLRVDDRRAGVLLPVLQDPTSETQFSGYERTTWRNEKFLGGLRDYLLKHQYSSVSSKDMWASLQESLQMPIQDWMYGWTFDQNYPVLSVSEDLLRVEDRLEENFFEDDYDMQHMTVDMSLPAATTSDATSNSSSSSDGSNQSADAAATGSSSSSSEAGATADVAAAAAGDAASTSSTVAAGLSAVTGSGSESTPASPPAQHSGNKHHGNSKHGRRLLQMSHDHGHGDPAPDSADNHPDPAKEIHGPEGTLYLTLTQTPIVASRTCGVAQTTADGKQLTGSGQWWIPILAAETVNGYNADFVQVATVNACETNISFVYQMGMDVKHTPLLLNVGRLGFYRVNYTEGMWHRLVMASPDASVIPEMDMAGLLSDAYRLSEAGMLSLEMFMKLAKYTPLRPTTELATWSVLISKLDRMRQMLSTAGLVDTDEGAVWRGCLSDFDDYVANNITGPAIEHVVHSDVTSGNETTTVSALQGFSFAVSDGKDTIKQRVARPMILSMSGRTGNTAVIQMAQDMMETAFADKKRPDMMSLHPDVRAVAYCLNIMGPDNVVTRKKAYNGIKDMYREEKEPVEKAKLLQSLTCAVDEELQDDLLAMVLSDEMPLQEVGIMLQHFGAQGGKALEKVWNFFIYSMDKLLSRFPDPTAATYTLAEPLKQLVSAFTDTSKRAALEKLVEEYVGVMDQNLLKIYDAATATNAAWLQAEGFQLCTYLSKKMKHINIHHAIATTIIHEEGIDKLLNVTGG